MVGAVEGELEEADGGFRREGGAEFGDVERSVDEIDGVVCGFFDVEGEGEERDDVALRHEGEEYHVFSLLGHCFWCSAYG